MSRAAEKLLTAEEYAQTTDEDGISELEQGRIVRMPFHGPRHGAICSRVGMLILNHVKQDGLGRAFLGTGIITRRDPDTVRGPDLSYCSYERYPKADLSDDYFSFPPELVFEVLEPYDRWDRMLGRIAEYLEMGTSAVSVVDPAATVILLFRPDHGPQILGPDDEWAAPEILGDFRVPVRRFFE
jgi:Uma2 family endonuclease